MLMGFWEVGRVGNSYGIDSPRVSRDLVLQNLKRINFLFIFSIFHALDACLMVHGKWLKAHGSWPREARGGSWLMARGRPGPGNPEARFRSRSGPARVWVPRAGPGRPLAMSHEPPLASLGHEP